MSNSIWTIRAAAVVLVLCISQGFAAEAEPAKKPTDAKARTKAATVVLLEIDYTDPKIKGQRAGDLLEDLIVFHLQAGKQIKAVDRKHLEAMARERSLDLADLTAPTGIRRAAKILGANHLVTVRGLAMEKRTIVTVRIIDTSTSEIRVGLVDVEESLALSQVAQQVSEQMQNVIRGWVPENESPSTPPLPKFPQGYVAPKVWVVVPETHLFGRRSFQPPDPAGETALTATLLRGGVTVLAAPGSIKVAAPRALSDYENAVARADANRQVSDLIETARKQGIELLIVGEAFSETGPPIGSLVTSRARVELKLIDPSDGHIMASISEHAGASDISEVLAGKAALRTAGHRLGRRILKLLPKLR